MKYPIERGLLRCGTALARLAATPQPTRFGSAPRWHLDVSCGGGGKCVRRRTMKPGRERVIMVRKIHLGEDDGSFDLEFWERIGPEGRFAAAWDAVIDLVRMGKLDEPQLRLQRSSTRLVRRTS